MPILDGESFYSEKFSMVFYRGNGANTIVSVPEDFKVTGVKPFYPYSFKTLESGDPALVWDEALGVGILVKILLEPIEESD